MTFVHSTNTKMEYCWPSLFKNKH